jgi:hypothetical protein
MWVDITSGISGVLVMVGVVKALGKVEVPRSNPPDSIFGHWFVCVYIYIYISIEIFCPLTIVYQLSILLPIDNIGVVHQI